MPLRNAWLVYGRAWPFQAKARDDYNHWKYAMPGVKRCIDTLTAELGLRISSTTVALLLRGVTKNGVRVSPTLGNTLPQRLAEVFGFPSDRYVERYSCAFDEAQDAEATKPEKGLTSCTHILRPEDELPPSLANSYPEESKPDVTPGLEAPPPVTGEDIEPSTSPRFYTQARFYAHAKLDRMGLDGKQILKRMDDWWRQVAVGVHNPAGPNSQCDVAGLNNFGLPVYTLDTGENTIIILLVHPFTYEGMTSFIIPNSHFELILEPYTGLTPKEGVDLLVALDAAAKIHSARQAYDELQFNQRLKAEAEMRGQLGAFREHYGQLQGALDKLGHLQVGLGDLEEDVAEACGDNSTLSTSTLALLDEAAELRSSLREVICKLK